MLTQELLKFLLHYDPETGIFTRIVQNTTGGSGWKHKDGYIYLCISGKTYSSHRIAWLYITGKFPTYDIDHINGIKHDNRFSNLRDVPTSLNMQNELRVRKNNQSGFMGVHFRKDRNKWIATIRINGKPKRLGSFATPEEAEAAYINGKRIFHEGFTL